MFLNSQKTLTVVAPLFNEADNLVEFYQRIIDTFKKLDGWDCDIIFIDNASTDGSKTILRSFAAADKRIKLIFNRRNYGHIRSPYHGLMCTSTNFVALISTDLEEPPEFLLEMIKTMEETSCEIVLMRKLHDKNTLRVSAGKLYYKVLNKLSKVKLVESASGFGLYKKIVIDEIRKIQEPYPYLRGLISELGFKVATLSYRHGGRNYGVSKSNIGVLYDLGITGIVQSSIAPLRILGAMGLLFSCLSFAGVLLMLILKTFFWDLIPFGYAPLAIILFMLAGFQFAFLWLLGEYVIVILRKNMNRPIVDEEERVNF